MNEVSLPLTGGCQCGTLRYGVSKAPLVLYACHCTNCQRQTGSAFVLSMGIYEDALSFTAGEPARVSWTSDAGTERYGLFCGGCGGRIANGQTPTIGVYSLRAGTLDDPSWLRTRRPHLDAKRAPMVPPAPRRRALRPTTDGLHVPDRAVRDLSDLHGLTEAAPP